MVPCITCEISVQTESQYAGHAPPSEYGIEYPHLHLSSLNNSSGQNCNLPNYQPNGDLLHPIRVYNFALVKT